jgi:hypothetical protein
MTSSCGIHIDSRSLKVVALDGGPRKHRVVARFARDLTGAEDPMAAITAALREAAVEHRLRPESIHLALDSGQAAFRSLTLPFDDRDKIEEVIKYEIESEFPQWNIDDVIVDFLVLSTKPGSESSLLVIGVPKAPLEQELQACEKAGLDPQEAELDGTALFNAAHAQGLLAADSAQLLVHVGDSSTTVVLVDGGKLASMRAIRAGALPPLAPSAPPAPAAEGDEGEGGEGPAPVEASSPERAAETARRIRRELTRTISGTETAGPITAVYACGHELGGLGTEPVLGVPVQAWPATAGAEAGEDPDARRFAIAFGAALRGFGAAPLETNLRRENLRYAGRFERLELPLAVFSLLLCTLLAVTWIITEKRIEWRDEGNLAKDRPGDMQLWLRQSNIFLLPDPENGVVGRLKNPPPDFLAYVKEAEAGNIVERTKYQEILDIKNKLQAKVDELKRDLGQVSDIKQPQSALRATTLVMSVIDGLGAEVGRVAVRSVGANYQQGNQRKPDSVEVTLDMDFFAEDDVEASKHYNALRREILAQPWCVEMPDRPSKPFDTGKGLGVDGISVQVDLAQVPEEGA